MSSSKSAGDAESKSPRPDSADESEDESEVLEESPCGRWQKRREEVTQRDVPGIDCAFLAMDTEEGMEVVWNEAQFSEKKNYKAQQDKIKQVFDNLIQLEHANIVKFHKYWTDTKTDKPRVIFITEYMSSGSLKQFLKKTKNNNKTLKSWKRWCTQILSALSYLHSCDPPIIHGNLTCDTIFIQHNGLIKIGSVAPDAIHQHVKTMNEMKNMHYIAPEYGGTPAVPVTTAVDIYSFGMCALEMAVLEIQGNGDSGRQVTEESIMKTLGSLEDLQQRDFIEACLNKNPKERLKARELLFHKVLFEVHSLKLLAAHNFIQHSNALSENITENRWLRPEPELVIAEIKHPGDREPVSIQVKQLPVLELEKFLEDVKNGIYPLTAFEISRTRTMRPRPPSPEVAESVKSETPEPADVESRSIVKMSCSVRKLETEAPSLQMTILLRMDDKMNRQLECDFTNEDSAHKLAEELVFHGFINKGDQDKVATLMEDSIRNGGQNSKPAQLIVTNT